MNLRKAGAGEQEAFARNFRGMSFPQQAMDEGSLHCGDWVTRLMRHIIVPASRRSAPALGRVVVEPLAKQLRKVA